ncbi:MAG: hypothetical protein HQK65_16195 [Desulfamplus sp.]|nr:hypothetical protein [Desulfamplus sp.]
MKKIKILSGGAIKVLLLSFGCCLLVSACGSQEAEVSARIVSDDIDLNLDQDTSVTYTIEAEEDGGQCAAKQVTVEVITAFFDDHLDVVTTHNIGNIAAGGSSKKTFTISFSPGDTWYVDIKDVDIGEADCPLF